WTKISLWRKGEKIQNSTSILDNHPPGWMWNHG
ncbi:unnamed protein product, partial [marine sediment metagenome]